MSLESSALMSGNLQKKFLYKSDLPAPREFSACFDVLRIVFVHAEEYFVPISNLEAIRHHILFC
jgi:hypothetical protein